MKLIYKIQLSFGILLVGILLLTAVLVYPLLLNTLVDNQRNDLREQAAAMMELVESLPAKDTSLTESTEAVIMQPAKPIEGNINAIVIEPDQNILFSTMSSAQSTVWLDLIQQNLNKEQNGLWQGPDEQYIVETFQLNKAHINSASDTVPATLVMSTPLSKVKSIQFKLFSTMMIILVIGGCLAFLLSLFITKRIVTPLGKLKRELKKVEKRHFNEVQLIQSGGEIGEVAQSVYQLAGELNRYHHAQKQFFQNASHELKTPLMTIQGYAEGIRDGVFTGDRADNGLDVITNECERLKGIVSEMILLAKLESEEGIFDQVDVSVKQLIHQILELINPQAINKGVELKVEYLVEEPNLLYINGDSKKLLQAVLNIVSNAVRHATQAVCIQISQRDGQVRIEVIDDGDGIADSLLPQLFQRFIKGKNGELGLGLAIARAIIERCHGEIFARNGEYGGAIFQMCFPLCSCRRKRAS